MLKETGMGDAEHGKFHPSHSALFSSQRSPTFGRFVKKKWEQIWDLRALPGHQEGDGLRLPSAAQRCPPSPLPTPGTKQVFISGTTLTHFLFYLICTRTKKDPFTICALPFATELHQLVNSPCSYTSWRAEVFPSPEDSLLTAQSLPEAVICPKDYQAPPVCTLLACSGCRFLLGTEAGVWDKLQLAASWGLSTSRSDNHTGHSNSNSSQPPQWNSWLQHSHTTLCAYVPPHTQKHHVLVKKPAYHIHKLNYWSNFVHSSIYFKLNRSFSLDCLSNKLTCSLEQPHQSLGVILWLGKAIQLSWLQPSHPSHQ